MSRFLRRWGPWLAIVVVAAVALGVGSSGDGERAGTAAARANRIASEVRCPTCRGLSAAESDAKAAQAVRDEIRRRVDAGGSDAEIKEYLASRYGDDILLRPPSSGPGSVVWALPATAVVLAAAGLALAFRRWRAAAASPEPAAPSELENVRGATEPRTSSRSAGGPARRGLVGLGIAVVAVGAGVALAAAAGDRRPGDPLSGDIPASPAVAVGDERRDPRLDRAQALLGEGKAVDAVKLYDEILRDHPELPEALAYRGWLVRLAGLADEGLAYIDRAIAADPTYPDAHFFRGMILWQDKRDAAGGAAEFRLFLANNPPPAMVELVEDALERALADAAAAGQPVPTSTTAPAAPADPEGG